MGALMPLRRVGSAIGVGGDAGGNRLNVEVGKKSAKRVGH